VPLSWVLWSLVLPIGACQWEGWHRMLRGGNRKWHAAKVSVMSLSSSVKLPLVFHGVQEITLTNPNIVNSKKNTELKYLAPKRI